MARYWPVLKAREGEFKALGRLRDHEVSRIHPLFEVCPSDDGPTKSGLKFVRKVREAAPAGLTLGVDTTHVRVNNDGRPLIREIADDLAQWGIPIAPVIRLHDPDEQLSACGEAARLHNGTAIIRLGSPTADPDPVADAPRISRAMSITKMSPDRCHLVVDMGEVSSDRDVSRAEQVIRNVLDSLDNQGWASIVVASGAMPPTITSLPRNEATPLTRWDWKLWRRLADRGPDFGDYAIAHPAMPPSGVRGPLPSLRYAASDNWWIYRWARYETGGNDSFYDLCQALTSSDHWPAEGSNFSWGDSELARCARRQPGPGGATQWRAWGTSHHFAHVMGELASCPAS
ncbi:beta family protein [Micromonospora sp. NPDC023956]|uniref:beta family protein n=1 Tax=Micromonospora sp. NPDC023956 TaxID=3155722 RepID=UPI0033CE851D